MAKGHTNNPNGRPKGQPNKVTATVRAWLLEVINTNRDQIENDLKQLEPAERIEAILKLLPYILPKAVNPDEVEGAAFTKDDVKVYDRWEIEEKASIKQWYEAKD